MKNRFYLATVNPLRGLTELQLVGIMDEGERGAYAYLQWLYRFVEKRNHAARAVKRRLLAALGSLDWSIELENTGEDATAKAMAESQAETLRKAYSQVANLREALNHLALADLRGFAHCEKIYRGAGAEGDPWDVIELRPVPQWFWVRDGLYGPWEYNPEATTGTVKGQAMDLRADGRMAKFVVRELDDPANEIIAKAHVRQETNDADWDGFLEDYGVPPMFVEMPPNVPPEKEKEYQALAEKALSRSRGAFPNGAKLQTPSATGSGGVSIFKERLDYLESQIVIAGTSGKLTILSESGSGTLAGEAQKQAFDEIAQAIAYDVSEAMWKDFDAEILARLHPGEPVLAYFEFAPVDKEDTGAVLDDAVKANQAGYAMDDEQLSEKSGYKLTRIAATAPQTSTPQIKTEAVPNATGPSAQTSLTPPALPGSPPASTPEATPPESAASPGADAGAASDAIARQLRVTPEFVAPAKSVIDELLAKAADGSVSDAELLASADDLLRRLPELAGKWDSTGVADAMQAGLVAAVEKTLKPA